MRAICATGTMTGRAEFLTSMVERDDFYGYTQTTVTNRYVPYQERPPFLVAGVLHSTMTLFYGEKGTGKSTLAATLAAALANGAGDFLRQSIATTGRQSVGVIAGDFGDDEAYGDQLRNVLDDGAKVIVYGLDRPPVVKTWEGLQLAARRAKHGLVIVDNMTSFVNGSLSDDISVNRFYDEMDKFVRDGRAVLVIAHSSEKSGEHGKSRLPMGSSVIRARARWTCFIESNYGNTRLTFDGNYGAPHQMIVSPPNGTAAFSVVSAIGPEEFAAGKLARSRTRRAQTEARREGIADFVLESCQGLSQAVTAEKIEAQFDGAVSTHKTHLSRGAYGVMMDRASHQWVRVRDLG